MPITAAPWLLSEHALHVLHARPRQNTAKPTNAMGVFRANGNLELAPPIPFRIAGTAEQPQLTVTLALWYIGMLAAEHQPPHTALIDPCGSLTSPREYSNSSVQTPLPLKVSESFDNIEPTEISFLKKLHAQRFSEIFLVNIRSETCVMKVVSLLEPRTNTVLFLINEASWKGTSEVLRATRP